MLVALIYMLTGVGGMWSHANTDTVDDSSGNAVAAMQTAMTDACDAASQAHGACTAAHASCHPALLEPVLSRRAGDSALGFRRDFLRLKPSSLIQVQDHPPPKTA